MRHVKSLAVVFTGLFAALTVNAQTVDSEMSIDEKIAGAVLPLPEDLRVEATVFTYDSDNGERIVLRPGSNQVECRPKNADGFTRCFPVSDAARRDLSAKLEAEGISGDELQTALVTAEANGTIEPRKFGSLRYRLYDNDDRIQLLWVVVMPNATSMEMGVSTGSQRDNSLAGRGRPWMMLEGTPNAHLMIPINGTEFSNSL